jgi:hypothetical protein
MTGELHTFMEQFGSPVPAIPDAEEGMDKHAQEYANEDCNPVRITPSAARPGKEVFHEERHQASECALGVQESGKRKAMRHVIVNSTSSEGSDPGESAQKHHRLHTSSSPIIVKERVSHSLVLLGPVQCKYASVIHVERYPFQMQLDCNLRFFPCVDSVVSVEFYNAIAFTSVLMQLQRTI